MEIKSNSLSVSGKKIFIRFIFEFYLTCMSVVYMCVRVPHEYLLPVEAGRKHQILELELQMVAGHSMGPGT